MGPYSNTLSNLALDSLLVLGAPSNVFEYGSWPKGSISSSAELISTTLRGLSTSVSPARLHLYHSKAHYLVLGRRPASHWATTASYTCVVCFTMVPRAGLEPARLAAVDFKSTTSTHFVTGAINFKLPVTLSGAACTLNKS